MAKSAFTTEGAEQGTRRGDVSTRLPCSRLAGPARVAPVPAAGLASAAAASRGGGHAACPRGGSAHGPLTPEVPPFLRNAAPRPSAAQAGRRLPRRCGPRCARAEALRLGRAGSRGPHRAGVHPTCLFLGNVTSASGPQMASGVSLGSLHGRADGMQQRSCSVSSADQWTEAAVIANSAVSSGKRGRRPTDPRPPPRPRLQAGGARVTPRALCAALCAWPRGAATSAAHVPPPVCGVFCPRWAPSRTSARLFLFGTGRGRCSPPPDRCETWGHGRDRWLTQGHVTGRQQI